MYGRMLINRIRERTESVKGEEQFGFRCGIGCVNQMFAVRQVCEKSLQKVRVCSEHSWILKRRMTELIERRCRR
jgi:hypothetical protein